MGRQLQLFGCPQFPYTMCYFKAIRKRNERCLVLVLTLKIFPRMHSQFYKIWVASEMSRIVSHCCPSWDEDWEAPGRPLGVFRVSCSTLPHYCLLSQRGRGRSGKEFPPLGSCLRGQNIWLKVLLCWKTFTAQFWDCHSF